MQQSAVQLATYNLGIARRYNDQNGIAFWGSKLTHLLTHSTVCPGCQQCQSA